MKTIMKFLKVILIITCITLLSSAETLLAQNTEFSRYGAIGFGIGTKGFMGTGRVKVNGVFSLKKDFWEYDPATDSWTQKADFGGLARYNAVGFSIGTKGYIGTGMGGGNDFWEYDPTLNKWTRKAEFGGSVRGTAAGFSIGSKGYVGTGYSFVNGILVNLNDFWEYTPGTGKSKGTWKRIADLPGNPRYGAVGFGVGLKGYLTTGINYIDSTHYTFYKDTWEYDPNKNPKTGGTWTRKTDFAGTPRAFAVGFSINNTRGYIGTGNTGNNVEGYKNDFWEYNPGNATTPWTQKADFPGIARDCAVGFSIGARGYIGTGLTWNNYDSLVQDFWQYDPGTIPSGPGTWLQKADFGMNRAPVKEVASGEITTLVSNDNLVVYPNPSGSSFNFRLTTTSSEPVDLKIFDMTGRLIQEYTSISPDKIIKAGENLGAGIYIAVLTQGEFRKTVKLNKVN